MFLENVDRLLKSPATQRGRDFAVMLKSLSDLGYAVEWRVINAAEYGMPQRRRRVFILGYHKSTSIYKQQLKEKKERLLDNCVLQNAFPFMESSKNVFSGVISKDIKDVSDNFNKKH